MQYVPCPLCGSKEGKGLFTATDRLGLAKGIFTVFKCGSCGLSYLNPRPDESELGGYYPATYWGDRQKGLREYIRRLEEQAKERYKVQTLMKAGLSPCRIIDIGCGRGEFLAPLREKGFEVHGLEPGEEAARRGSSEYGIDIMHGTLGSAKLPDSYYDAATLWHVLEHLPDPLGALGEISGALRTGGRLFVAVPDFGSWQAGRFKEDWFGVDAPRHLTHFTRRTLAAMLEKAGFRVLMTFEGGARYETAMFVRSLFPGLNRRKLETLDAGTASKYIYKAAQLFLDIGLLPFGALISATGRGCTIVMVSEKV
jgi:2-polyprenyl-3-methyl-5-hydroxy-6-metoxy-1,4-benzoquinol methylase